MLVIFIWSSDPAWFPSDSDRLFELRSAMEQQVFNGLEWNYAPEGVPESDEIIRDCLEINLNRRSVYYYLYRTRIFLFEAIDYCSWRYEFIYSKWVRAMLGRWDIKSEELIFFIFTSGKSRRSRRASVFFFLFCHSNFAGLWLAESMHACLWLVESPAHQKMGLARPINIDPDYNFTVVTTFVARSLFVTRAVVTKSLILWPGRH